MLSSSLVVWTSLLKRWCLLDLKMASGKKSGGSVDQKLPLKINTRCLLLFCFQFLFVCTRRSGCFPDLFLSDEKHRASSEKSRGVHVVANEETFRLHRMFFRIDFFDFD